MAHLSVVHGEWVNLKKPGGQVFFVSGGTVAYKGSGGSDGGGALGRGTTPQQPFSTIQAALDVCVAGRGDTVIVLPGSVTITAALTMSKADVTLSGFADDSPIKPCGITSSLASSADAINVSAANCVIENLHFPASTAATTGRIDAGAAGLLIQDCTFECGANDLESITIPAAGLHTTIRNNRFYITANGPDAAIEIEHASAYYINIEDNVFHGGNDTNGWDTGAINSAVANLDCVVSGNTSTFGPAIIFSAAATGMIKLNNMGEGTLGSMLDPGSCMCHENYESDAIDQTARLFPATVAS